MQVQVLPPLPRKDEGMKYQEKLDLLKQSHPREWVDEYRTVENEVSTSQSMFCVCGQLATGLHEGRCKKFNDLVSRKTVQRLKHLIDVNNQIQVK